MPLSVFADEDTEVLRMLMTSLEFVISKEQDLRDSPGWVWP